VNLLDRSAHVVTPSSGQAACRSINLVGSASKTACNVYGHVLFKGLEGRAVILVVDKESAFERSRERLYVGLSRARDQLVVCGDPEFIREVGGPDLARRLNVLLA
jgi:hypothetical protein